MDTMETLPVAYKEGRRLSVVERAARLFVQRRKATWTFAWGVVFGITAIVMMAGWFDVKDIGAKDFLVPNSQDSKNEDALDDARAQAGASAGFTAARSEVSKPTETNYIFEWSDASRDDEILTATNLQLMCDFQRYVTGAEGYANFCLPSGGVAAGAATVCAEQPFDLVAKFYATVAEQAECATLNATTFTARLEALEADEDTIAFFQTRDAATPTAKRTRTRSAVALYGPLGADSTPSGVVFQEVIDGDSDRDTPQAIAYLDFLKPIELDIFEAFGITLKKFMGTGYDVGAFQLGGGLQVRFQNDIWLGEEFERVINGDLLLAAGSIIFVGAFMRVHSRSTWITVNCMLSVVLSLVVGIFFYSGVFGVDYFTTIQSIVIFLVLGLGADNVFVYFDTFEQSRWRWPSVRGIKTVEEAQRRNVYGTGVGSMEVLIARIAYTYQRATPTIFTTNLTTTLAFLSTGVSEVAPVAGFGYFAACCVVSNFLFSVALYPSVAVLSEMYWRTLPSCVCLPCCCRPSVEPLVDKASSSPVTLDSLEAQQVHNGKAVRVTREEHPETWEEKIVSKAYVPLLFNTAVTARGKPVRFVAWICVLGLFVLMCVMAAFALQLSPPDELVDNFSSDHMDNGFQDDYFGLYKGGSDFMNVEVTFGISGIDRDCFSRFDPNGCRGSAIFDDNFDLAPRASQQFVLDLCADLSTLSCDLEGCVDDDDLAVRSVDCTLQAFHDWHNATHPADPLPALLLGDSDPALWISRLSEFTASTGQQRSVGFIDGALRFFVIGYESSLVQDGSVNVKEPVLDLLDAFLASAKSSSPDGVATFFQTSADKTFLQTELAMVDGIFIGLAISMPVAFVVLLLSTGNVIIAAFGIINILGVVVAVLGTAYLLDFGLDIATIIATVTTVGLSVDYAVIHGIAYSQAASDGVRDRVERTRISALVAGHTIIAGAITTIGAALVMYLTTVVFFSTMGTLISLTIFFSYAFTEFWFMPLCLLFGPEGDRGNWILWIKKCRSGSAADAK